MRRIPGWIGPAAVVFAAIVLSEVPGIKQTVQAIDRHKESLFAVTISLLAFGFTVFMGGILSMVMASGDAMTHEEIESAIRQRRRAGQPAVSRASAHRVFGAAARRPVANEASFAGIKDAWRTGEWRRDTEWLRLFVIAAGAVMFFYGTFGILLVVGPMHVKVLAAGVMTYVTGMIVWGFTRA